MPESTPISPLRSQVARIKGSASPYHFNAAFTADLWFAWLGLNTRDSCTSPKLAKIAAWLSRFPDGTLDCAAFNRLSASPQNPTAISARPRPANTLACNAESDDGASTARASL